MRDLIIYGVGGFGRETALMVRQINCQKPAFNLLGFCDDNLRKGTTVHGMPVIGSVVDLNDWPRPVSVALAVADPHIRKEIRGKIRSPRIDFPVLMHPSVIADDQTNRIQEGSIIGAGTILTTDITIHAFVMINLACTIGHDVVIHEYCSVMPGCSVSGSVTLKGGVLLGTGARVLPGLTVSEHSRVGAGAVVTRNVEAGTTVTGVPARPVHHKQRS